MSSATFVLFVREPPRRLCRPLYCQGLCQLSEQYPMSLIYTFSLISCNPIKKMSPEDTSGVSPSPPSPSTTDTVTKMIKNNKWRVIIGASSVLVLMMMIIIIATTTNTTTEVEALTEQVSLSLRLIRVRGAQL